MDSSPLKNLVVKNIMKENVLIIILGFNNQDMKNLSRSGYAIESTVG